MWKLDFKLLLTIVVQLYLNTLSSQKLLRPQVPEISKFPSIEGELWYRGFGQTALTKEQLVIAENGGRVDFELENFKGIQGKVKNKKVLLLIENHWLPIGIEEREFFSSVVSKGILGAVNPGDQFMVCSFDWFRNGKYLFQETLNYTDDENEIVSSVKAIKAKEYRPQLQVGSDINEALMESLRFLGSSDDSLPAAIFLLSDELDNTVGKMLPIDVKLESNNRNIPIYAISYFNSIRYGHVIKEQICVPSFGLYYVNKQNDIDSAADKLNWMLNSVIQNSQGTMYRYYFNSDKKYAGKSVDINFNLKLRDVSASLTILYPSMPILEWMAENQLLSLILLLASVIVITMLVLVFTRYKENKKRQIKILLQTQSDLIEQSNKGNLERIENEKRFEKIQLEQKSKEIEAEKLKNIEKNNVNSLRLERLMHLKGVFPKLNYIVNGRKESVVISKTLFTIGRDKSNDLFIDLITISKNHVLILFLEDGGFLLSDMNSTNGTCVNGLNIKEQLLKNGDTIQIGSVKLEFQV
jgi:hypothetical protein